MQRTFVPRCSHDRGLGSPLPRVLPCGRWPPSGLPGCGRLPHPALVCLSVNVCVQTLPPHKDIRHTGLLPTLMTSF